MSCEDENFPFVDCGSDYGHKSSLYQDRKHECGKEVTCGISETKDFHCDNCGRGYRHKSSLYQHRKNECGKEANFRCSFCHYWTKQRSLESKLVTATKPLISLSTGNSNIQRQVAEDDPKLERIKCQNCDQTYYPTFVDIHKKLFCGLISSATSVESNLHTTKQQLLTLSADNSNTQRQVAEDEPKLERIQSYPFQCENCLKMYRYKRNLQDHQRFDCNTEAKFTFGKDVDNFNYTFVCMRCRHRFLHKRDLLQHLKEVCGSDQPFMFVVNTDGNGTPV
ncbi:zinc finger protein 761-like [Macrosteles quadrilineatus]|uniref:zinc finger protein 761-like n=1 Tax=Macrosteles quadrilineatus TaxID=74068 RepID=UPI0023E2FA0F|nr:zinc finger protein 761-like [Macrosteles quadrilineatus]